MGCIPFYGLNKIRNKVISFFELYIYVRPLRFHSCSQTNESVVNCDTEEENNKDESKKQDHDNSCYRKHIASLEFDYKNITELTKCYKQKISGLITFQ